MVKLYYYKAACSLVVRIVLNELGLSFEDEAVDLLHKKTASGADFLAINPKGAVPTFIMENGQVLTENQVILQYLVDSTPGQRLLAPVGELARYRCLEWLNYIATELHKSIGFFYNPALAEEVKSQVLIPAIIARFTYLNNHLAENAYLMGDSFSLPDAYLYVMVLWARYFKMDLSALQHLQTFMHQLNQRPSVIKSLKQEELIK